MGVSLMKAGCSGSCGSHKGIDRRRISIETFSHSKFLAHLLEGTPVLSQNAEINAKP